MQNPVTPTTVAMATTLTTLLALLLDAFGVSIAPLVTALVVWDAGLVVVLPLGFAGLGPVVLIR